MAIVDNAQEQQLRVKRPGDVQSWFQHLLCERGTIQRNQYPWPCSGGPRLSRALRGHDQHRHGGVAQYPVCNTAVQPAIHVSPAIGGHGDQIGMGLFGGGHDDRP
ncbi:MAG TPA: hypothetical protein VF937_09885, partial [Chloroflexota bacterium]